MYFKNKIKAHKLEKMRGTDVPPLGSAVN